MPTIRFYKLNLEKRRRIWNAAFHEFSRVPLEKASINRIIREAGISRGSYYTYFSDKWDVLMFVMEEASEQLHAQISVFLEESGGDFWKMMEHFLSCMLEMCSEKDKKEFLKNVMESSGQDKLNREFWKTAMNQERLTRENTLAEEVYQRCVGISIIQMKKEDFQIFFHMALFLLWEEVRMFVEGDSERMIWIRFRTEANILKQGVGIPMSKMTEHDSLSVKAG